MAPSLACVRNQATAEWEARAELDVGVLIHAYLATHPAPGESDLSQRLGGIAEDLQVAGRTRLRALGSRALVAIGGGA